ncbi:hypothetical protein MMC25_001034 [Agyrium rufum]|nr:hypothetical protein [Agyrium rufum]
MTNGAKSENNARHERKSSRSVVTTSALVTAAAAAAQAAKKPSPTTSPRTPRFHQQRPFVLRQKSNGAGHKAGKNKAIPSVGEFHQLDCDEPDEDMATGFLQFCAMCEKQIAVPNNSILYCSESCRRKDSQTFTPMTALSSSLSSTSSTSLSPTNSAFSMSYSCASPSTSTSSISCSTSYPLVPPRQPTTLASSLFSHPRTAYSGPSKPPLNHGFKPALDPTEWKPDLPHLHNDSGGGGGGERGTTNDSYLPPSPPDSTISSSSSRALSSSASGASTPAASTSDATHSTTDSIRPLLVRSSTSLRSSAYGKANASTCDPRVQVERTLSSHAASYLSMFHRNPAPHTPSGRRSPLKFQASGSLKSASTTGLAVGGPIDGNAFSASALTEALRKAEGHATEGIRKEDKGKTVEGDNAGDRA